MYHGRLAGPNGGHGRPVLYQRVGVRYGLLPVDLEKTAGYIEHHLRVAGFQGSLFSDSFIGGVYDHTKGVTRRINNVCRSALLLGASETKQVLDEADLKRSSSIWKARPADASLPTKGLQGPSLVPLSIHPVRPIGFQTIWPMTAMDASQSLNRLSAW